MPKTKSRELVALESYFRRARRSNALPDEAVKVLTEAGFAWDTGNTLEPGVNDLTTLRPDIAAEWDDVGNDGLRPEMVLPGSHQKVWWQCKKHHSWQARISSRTMPKGSGCPYCTNQKVLPGFNDLATMRPDIAKEWDDELNGKLKPNMVPSGSRQKVWWQCKKHHSWQAIIRNRTKPNGNNCPYCTNKKVLPGFNDLATMRPDIAAEWDDDGNDDLRPDMVTPGSRQKVWWRCKKHHRWQTRISNRTKPKGSDCPYCANRKVLPGFNDLATVRPDIAEEWDKELNDDLTPDMVLPGSVQKVWWRNKDGRRWQASILGRTRTKTTVKSNGCE